MGQHSSKIKYNNATFGTTPLCPGYGVGMKYVILFCFEKDLKISLTISRLILTLSNPTSIFGLFFRF